MRTGNHQARSVVGGSRGARSMVARWLCVVTCVGALVVPPAGAAVPEDDGPAILRPEFWEDQRAIGQRVVQVFGHVFAFHDKADIATKYFWVLDDSAVGKVVEVIPAGKDTLVRVEFPDETGWSRKAVPPPTTEMKWSFDYDNYGRPEAATVTMVKKEGIPVAPREWGRVVDEAGERRVVEFPVENLGLRRPRRGDRVVRGPDWRAGYADGGENPFGPASADCVGRIVEELGSDRYLRVQWEKTGREGVYRFDKRRFYDVEVVE